MGEPHGAAPPATSPGSRCRHSPVPSHLRGAGPGGLLPERPAPPTLPSQPRPSHRGGLGRGRTRGVHTACFFDLPLGQSAVGGLLGPECKHVCLHKAISMGNHALTQDCSQCPHRLGELLLDARWARLSTRNRTSSGVSRGPDPPPPPTTLVTLGVRLTGTGVQCCWVRVSGSKRLWTVKTNPHVLVMETPHEGASSSPG